MASKAALRSKRNKIAQLPESTANKRSFNTFSKADSLLWSCQTRLQLIRISYWWKPFPLLLIKMVILKLGDSFVKYTDLNWAFLRSGFTTACFRIDATVPWDRLLFIIVKTKGSTTPDTSLSIWKSSTRKEEIGTNSVKQAELESLTEFKSNLGIQEWILFILSTKNFIYHRF